MPAAVSFIVSAVTAHLGAVASAVLSLTAARPLERYAQIRRDPMRTHRAPVKQQHSRKNRC